MVLWRPRAHNRWRLVAGHGAQGEPATGLGLSLHETPGDRLDAHLRRARVRTVRVVRATHARGAISAAVKAAAAADRSYDRRRKIAQGSRTDKLIDGAVRDGAKAAARAVEKRIRRGC